jgi:uncharacterized RDD family membrane protein YckC
MLNEIAADRLPRIPLLRRAIAFLIDFVAAWLISALLSLNLFAQLSLFLVAWLGMRVALVSRNQGQSLGRWSVDTRVVDARFGKTPGLQALLKRELITGLGSACLIFGLISLAPGGNGWAGVLIVLPGIDYGIAVADSFRRQTFHDRIARTVISPSRRGYSLDIKVKNLLAKATRRMKR